MLGSEQQIKELFEKKIQSPHWMETGSRELLGKLKFENTNILIDLLDL